MILLPKEKTLTIIVNNHISSWQTFTSKKNCIILLAPRETLISMENWIFYSAQAFGIVWNLNNRTSSRQLESSINLSFFNDMSFPFLGNVDTVDSVACLVRFHYRLNLAALLFHLFDQVWYINLTVSFPSLFLTMYFR